jgi:Ca2+-binding RTX toxin-like protein
LILFAGSNNGGNRLWGNGLDNILRGRAEGGNRLYGEGGNDTLITQGRGSINHADDFFYGGDGDDFLDGGHGDNNYWGGAGDDIFFLGVHDRQPNRPTDKFGEVYIHDFVQGEDKFQLADYYTAVGLGEWQGDTNIYLWHRDFGSANNLDEFSFLNMFADTFSGEIIRFTGTLTEDDFVDLGDVNLVIF